MEDVMIPRREELLMEEIDSISNPVIRGLVEKAFDNVDDRFYSEAASTTAKYHPEFSLGEGGLVRHTLAVVHFVKRLIAAHDELMSYEKDLLIAAALLHDTCKCGLEFEEQWTVFEHPVLVYRLLDERNLTSEEIMFWNSINSIIVSHMGQWNKPNERDISRRDTLIFDAFSKNPYTSDQAKSMYDFCLKTKAEKIDSLELPVPSTKLQILLSVADYMAADKAISMKMFDFDKQYFRNKRKA